jgi:hypothetical protein
MARRFEVQRYAETGRFAQPKDREPYLDAHRDSYRDSLLTKIADKIGMWNRDARPRESTYNLNDFRTLLDSELGVQLTPDELIFLFLQLATVDKFDLIAALKAATEKDASPWPQSHGSTPVIAKASRARCPKLHFLVQHTMPYPGGYCDGCCKQIAVGAACMGCREHSDYEDCNFDLCEACLHTTPSNASSITTITVTRHVYNSQVGRPPYRGYHLFATDEVKLDAFKTIAEQMARLNPGEYPGEYPELSLYAYAGATGVPTKLDAVSAVAQKVDDSKMALEVFGGNPMLQLIVIAPTSRGGGPLKGAD